jgi:predicted Zn-dependent protease with MMP-like domain
MMVESGEFLGLVEQAVEGLPKIFKDRLENIAITVEDYPSPAVLRSLERPAGRHSLLGVYIGIPYNSRPAGPISGKLPDRIELYQRNIESVCRTPQEVVEQVRETIIHEVGHYFGLSEEDLDKLGN